MGELQRAAQAWQGEALAKCRHALKQLARAQAGTWQVPLLDLAWRAAQVHFGHDTVHVILLGCV